VRFRNEGIQDELLGQIMEQQKEDMDKYKQTESDIKLYEKFQKSNYSPTFTIARMIGRAHVDCF
jgi:hypothetical protein